MHAVIISGSCWVWWYGPRHDDELEAQALLIPRQAVFPFGLTEATLASDLYRRMKRPPRREIDIAIAACAIANDAALWTLKQDDFADIPGLTLVG